MFRPRLRRSVSFPELWFGITLPFSAVRRDQTDSVPAWKAGAPSFMRVLRSSNISNNVDRSNDRKARRVGVEPTHRNDTVLETAYLSNECRRV